MGRKLRPGSKSTSTRLTNETVMDHSGSQEEQPSADASTSASMGPDHSRRRLLRRGLAATPVLLTLVSRPAIGGGSYWGGGNWGGDWGGGGGKYGGKCVAPSGFVSMPTSQHGKTYSCTGCGPDYWKNCGSSKYGSEWPSPYCGSGSYDYWGRWTPPTKFRDCFYPHSRDYNCDYSSATFMDCLEKSAWSNSKLEVARHCIAGVLNARSGRTDKVCPESVVKGIWNEYASKGFFEPTAGVKWYADEICTYFRSLETSYA